MTKVIIQDFPGPGISKTKIQDVPRGMGTLYRMLNSNAAKYCIFLHCTLFCFLKVQKLFFKVTCMQKLYTI